MFINAKKRIAVIDYDSCNPEKCGGWFCEGVCPVNRANKECITHDAKSHAAMDAAKPVISEDLCIGCGLCVYPKGCPFDAISIINLQTDPGPPIHQFGQNEFRVHGLPMPQAGEVTGIVGRNGTGKTTALKILSGELTPNLGAFDQQSEWKKVIEHYRGRNTADYFAAVSSQKTKASVKPQSVDALPKAVKGNVADLLRRTDEKKELDRVIKGLGLEHVLERDIGQLSGGELQKVALAASYLKKSDLWFIDEPSSFLDIRERLRISRFIRENATDESKLVVEHDFILLDYLSDRVYLCTGKPGVYGIYSSPKSSREGLNEYLGGYLKEENLRFRDHAIAFYAHELRESKKTNASVSWPTLSKKLGDFELHVQAGQTFKGEVVGLLGPNGIGKTTFLRMLAGEIKPDNDRVELLARIAYKPQYLDALRHDHSVQHAFNETKKTLSDEALAIQIFKPLELESLLEKNLSNLSGGELQRVAIGLALCQEADLVLLDEPSAFLDIEQRLASAKAIRDIADKRETTVLVIDHDLSYIDAISDRLMVFSGTPALFGNARGPLSLENGFNAMLGDMGVTLRRDKGEFRRPRINKPGSVLDREQKQAGKYYFG